MVEKTGPIRVAFLGSPAFAATVLRALVADHRFVVPLVVTQPDRPAGRGGKLIATPVKEVALDNNITVVTPQSIRKEAETFAPLFKAQAVDVGVVVAFGQILPEWLLQIPAGGFVNIHASLLPRHRGAAPIHRAILEGDQESGVCLMKMEAGLDTGPVYAVAKTPITELLTTGELHDTLAELGTTLLLSHLSAIAQQKLPAIVQPEQGVTYAAKISNEEAQLDFKLPAAQLQRKIHAFSPAPGAFCFLKGERLKFFRAMVNPLPVQALPGTVLKATAAGIEIATGVGSLQVLDLQLAGKKRLSAEDFLKGVHLTPGSIVS